MCVISSLARMSPSTESLWVGTNVFLTGPQRITLYAGKSLRVIEPVVERDEDGTEELVNACFLRHQFDKDYGTKTPKITAYEAR
jgi:hypothetical protein